MTDKDNGRAEPKTFEGKPAAPLAPPQGPVLPQPPPTGAPWEDFIAWEVMCFVAVVQFNFNFSINQSLKHLPNPKDPRQRMTQLDYYIDGGVGLAVQFAADYGDASEKMEAAVVASVKQKFAYIREKQAEAAAERAKGLTQ